MSIKIADLLTVVRGDNSSLKSTLAESRADAQKSAAEIGKALSGINVKPALDSLKNIGATATQSADVYRDASGRMRDSTGKFVADANKASASVKSFSSETASSLSRTASSVNASLSSISKATGSIGTSLSIGVTAPLALASRMILDIGIDYQKSMNVFQAVTGATAEQMKRAADEAKRLGADMSLPATSAGNAAKAMTELAKSGLDATQSIRATPGVLQLAAAALIDEARAAEITGNALSAFKLEAGEAGRVSDLLAAAANASSAEITDVAASLQQSSASAAALKIPIEDLVAAIGEMANAGIKGSDAGTSLKTFLASLTPTTKAAAAAMKDLGIDAFDAQGNFVGLEAIIQQAAPALAKMSDEQKAYAIKAAFGSDAQRAANIILGQGVEKFQQMEGAVTKSGAAAELAAAKAKGLGGAWDGLKSQLETVALTIFEKAGPSLEKMVRGLADVVGEIGNVNPKLLEMGTVAATALGASGPVLLGISTVSNALKGLGAGAAGGPIALAIAGVVALATAYVTNFAGMKRTVDEFVANFSSGATTVNKQSGSIGDYILGASITATQGFDSILAGINLLIKGVVAYAKVQQQSFMFDFAGIVQTIETYESDVARITEQHDARYAERTRGLHVLMKEGWKGYFDDVARQSEQAFGQLALTGRFTAKEFADEYARELQLNSPAKITIDEIRNMKGPLRQEGKAAGFNLADAVVLGWDSRTRRSPFFIVHDLMDALAFAVALPPQFGAVGRDIGKEIRGNFESDFAKIEDAFIKFPATLQNEVSPKLKNAGKQIVKDMREAFQDALEMLNNWSSAVGSKIKFTAEIWAKFTEDVRRILLNHAKDHRKLQEDLQIIYAGIAAYPDKVVEASQLAMGKLIHIEEDGAAKRIAHINQVGAAVKNYSFTVNAVTGQVESHLTKQVGSWAAFYKAVMGHTVTWVKNQQGQLVIAAGSWEEFFLRVKASLEKQKEAYKRHLEDLDQQIREFSKNTEGLWGKIAQTWGQGIASAIAGVANGLGKVGEQSLETINKWSQKVGDVIRTMPDEIGGDFVRKWAAKIDEWLTFTDKVLGLFDTDLASVLQKAVGHFDQFFSTVLGKLKDFGGQLLGGLKSIFSNLGGGNALGFGLGAAGTVGGIALGGIGGSILTGAGIGAMLGSVLPGLGTLVGAGIGAVGGLIVGGIKKLFGGGASEAEKAAKEGTRLQLEAARQGVLKATEEAKQAMANTGKVVLDLLTGVGNYAGISRKQIKTFIRDMEFILKEMYDSLKKLADKNVQRTKEVSEAFLPAVALLGSVLDISNAMKDRHRPSPDDFKGVVEDFDLIGTLLEQTLADADTKVAKKIGKIASKIGPAFSLLKDSLDISKQMGETPDPDPEAIKRQVNGLFTVVEVYESEIDRFKTFALAKIKRTAEQVSAIARSIIDSMGLSKAINEAPPLDVSALTARLAELVKVLDWQDEMNNLAAEGLEKGLTFEDRMAQWRDTIARGLSALAGIAGGALSNFSNSISAGLNISFNPSFAGAPALAAGGSLAASRSGGGANHYGHTYQLHFGDMYFDGNPADPATHARFERIAERVFERVLDEADQAQMGGSRR